MKNQHNKGKKGFTLIEVIVIVVIIGILSAIAVPLYQGYIAQQNKKMVNDIAQSIAAAANGYFRQYNKDPTVENLNLYLINEGRFALFIDKDNGKLLVKDTTTNFESDSISFR